MANFNLDGAQATLEQIINETTNGLDLTNVMQNNRWVEGVKVNRVEYPTTWRLLRGGEGAEEEVVFTIRGIITAKDLPPILQRPRVSPGRYKYLRQSLTISGLGTARFGQGLATATEIYGIYDRAFPDGQMESWTSSSSPSLGDFVGIDASNRYLIPRRDVPSAQHQQFPASVDPKGILENMAIDSEHVHTEENQVLYFVSQVNADGKRTFDAAPPQIFRIGDIVELQISFVVVPLKGEHYKMITTLHSIALLDGTFAQSASAIKKAQRQPQSAPKKLLSIKRRVGYEAVEAESEGTEEKRGRMVMDDATNPLVTGFATQMNF